MGEICFGDATIDDTLCIPGRAVPKYGEFKLEKVWKR